jgi:hypothetical protein
MAMNAPWSSRRSFLMERSMRPTLRSAFVFCDAAAVLGCEDINVFLYAMGRAIGPPWQTKHKLAAAAAIAATEGT